MSHWERYSPVVTSLYGYPAEYILQSVVAAFLLVGGWTIGVHAYGQLVHSVPFFGEYVPLISHLIISSSAFDSHDTNNHPVPDLHAAWVAVISILFKEGMYRLSASVARSQNSPVLLANALHHRSDMYSSFVGLVAIVGNWFVPSLPLDPIGGESPYFSTCKQPQCNGSAGLLVTVLILHQALELLNGSLSELTDHGVHPNILDSISQIISAEIGVSPLSLNISPRPRDVRGIRRGAYLFIDATVDVSNPEKVSIDDAVKLEDAISRRVRSQKAEVKDIRLRLTPVQL